MQVRVLAVVAVVLLCGACSTGPPAVAVDATRIPSTSAASDPAVPWPATGALFGGPAADPGEHYCSASVVDAPGGDVVVTAAHCVATGDGSPPRTGMTFAPGYHDHIEPSGVWTVDTATVEPSWQSNGDIDHDIAILTVGRADGVPVESVTGGYELVTDPGPVNPVTAIGYPDFADAPMARSGVTKTFSATQLELDAHGLYDGTSGGPWLRDGHQVIGVTGGYEQGGLSPEVSYASYFDASVRALLDAATRTAP